MRFEPSVVEGAYLRDILSQPRALDDTVSGLRAAAGIGDIAKGFDRIVLTGMGGSYHALHSLYIQLASHGFNVAVFETSELIYYFPTVLTPRTLLVAVSQSGRSIEIVKLLDQTGSGVRTIGVTNTPDSPLGTRADITVLMHAGAEFTVSCKTYVATLVALEWLGAMLCGKERASIESTLAQAAPAAREYLTGWECKVATLVDLLAGIRALFVTGRGPSLAAAGTGGLILKESAHFTAEGMSCSAFRHGPFEMSGPDTFVVVFAGDPKTAALNQKLVRDIRAAGGNAYLAAPESDEPAFRIPAVAPEVLPVVEILPVQLISLALAALAGHEPGKFTLLAKVTTIE
jgi:glucosamine--fructose-6-phosphate aminotransferase (isomerizing)